MSRISGQTPKIDRSRRKARAPKAWVAKPRVGDKLGSFRLLEVLGEGGAGAVYRAEHTFLKRPVAIKVLHPELYLDSGMVARFFQEALAVNRARHRNLIDITDVVATEEYVSINPRSGSPYVDDLRRKGGAMGLKIVEIDELRRIARREAERHGAIPPRIETTDEVVEVIEWRDGTILDAIRRPV